LQAKLKEIYQTQQCKYPKTQVAALSCKKAKQQADLALFNARPACHPTITKINTIFYAEML
jgi:hypothetical protein